MKYKHNHNLNYQRDMEFLAANREEDSDTSSDDEQPTLSWEALSSQLSPSALQAIAVLGLEGEPLSREAVQQKAAEEVPVAADRKHAGSVMNAEFKKQEYWDSRFESEETYDWLCTYPNIRSHLAPLIKPTDKILVVGCGNSTFSADLYDDGYKNITNIDYSGNVVRAMQAKYSEGKPEMLWVEMNMLDLTFEDSSFDVVIDKAAMDALMVDEGDLWHPKEDCVRSAHQMCAGIARVLRDTGVHLQISFAQPHFRTKYLIGERYTNSVTSPYSRSVGKSEVYPWTLEFETISVEKGCLDSFFYIMRKC